MRIELSDASVKKLKPDAGIVRDKSVPGFFVVVGKHRRTFRFQRDLYRDGKRLTQSINLGVWGEERDGCISAKQAREKALALQTKALGGEITLRPPKGITLGVAFAKYCEDMRANDGSERWIRECERCFERNLKPWADEELKELSADPLRVRDWHKQIATTPSKDARRKSNAGRPTEANHAARLLRQTYNHSVRFDRTLPAANPTSAVKWCKEARAQTAIPFDKFPDWAKQVAALEAEYPLRAAFHRLCVLLGLRPGSVAQLQWSDIDCKRRTIHIGKFKTELDVTVPMGWQIAHELRRARDAGRFIDEERARKFVFPSVKSATGHLVNWLSDDVEYGGNSGRHTYRTIAADLGIDELSIQLLQGHSLASISHGYITRQVMVQGPSLRATQARMSRRIFELMSAQRR